MFSDDIIVPKTTFFSRKISCYYLSALNKMSSGKKQLSEKYSDTTMDKHTKVEHVSHSVEASFQPSMPKKIFLLLQVKEKHDL